MQLIAASCAQTSDGEIEIGKVSEPALRLEREARCEARVEALTEQLSE